MVTQSNDRVIDLTMTFTMPAEKVIETAKRLLSHSDADVRLVCEVFLHQTDSIRETQEAFAEQGIAPPHRAK